MGSGPDQLPRKRYKNSAAGEDLPEAELRRERLRLLNRREEIRNAQLEGKLVPSTRIAEVERAIGLEVRSQLMHLADRMAEVLVGKDGREIHALLEAEAFRVLGVLAKLESGPGIRTGRGGARAQAEPEAAAVPEPEQEPGEEAEA